MKEESNELAVVCIKSLEKRIERLELLVEDLIEKVFVSCLRKKRN